MEYGNKALQLFQAVVGDDHEHTASTYSALGCVFDKMGQFHVALRYHQDGLTRMLTCFGERHRKTSLILFRVGVVYLHLQQLDHASECLTKCEGLQRAGLGCQHPDYARTIAHLGKTLIMQGDRGQGWPLLVQGTDTLIAAVGDDHFDVRLLRDMLREHSEENEKEGGGGGVTTTREVS
jgi:hypothetical protein